MSMTVTLPVQASTDWYPWASNLDSEIRLIGGKVIDATTSANGLIRLAGDLGGTAAAPTVPGLALKAPIASPTFTGTVSGITKSMVGLANVDNTADTAKVFAASQITSGVIAIGQIPTGTTATTVALGNHLHTGVYEGVITAGTVTQYYRGDKTWATLDKTAVGLSAVDNTTDVAKLNSTDANVFYNTGTSSYPLRNTVTSDTTRRARFIGPVAPTIGGGYAITGLDVWEQTT